MPTANEFNSIGETPQARSLKEAIGDTLFIHSFRMGKGPYGDIAFIETPKNEYMTGNKTVITQLEYASEKGLFPLECTVEERDYGLKEKGLALHVNAE